MQNLAAANSFITRKLLTQNATAVQLTNEITHAANTLKSGGIFLLTFSGHGSQTRDSSGDEHSNEATSASIPGVMGKDETLCLYDRHFKDDELNQLLGKFAAGVRVLVIAAQMCVSLVIMMTVFPKRLSEASRWM